MKIFKISIAFFISLLILSCAKDTTTVGVDKNLNIAEFDTYKTYTFASHIDNADNDDFFWDSELMKLAVREEVKDELEGLGYVHKADDDADLLINFRVFEEPTEITGFVDNVADENYWGYNEMRKKMIGLVPEAEIRNADDATTYYLDKGSIIIHMVDLDKNALIWQGYVSGVLENASMIGDDEVNIAEAIELIFDEYNYTAAGYAANN